MRTRLGRARRSHAQLRVGGEGTPRAPEDPPLQPAGVGTSPLKWFHLFPFPAPPLPSRQYSPTPPAPCVLSLSPCPHPSPLPALSLGPPLAPGPTSTPRFDPLRGFRGGSASVPRGHGVSRMPVGCEALVGTGRQSFPLSSRPHVLPFTRTVSLFTADSVICGW